MKSHLVEMLNKATIIINITVTIILNIWKKRLNFRGW